MKGLNIQTHNHRFTRIGIAIVGVCAIFAFILFHSDHQKVRAYRETQQAKLAVIATALANHVKSTGCLPDANLPPSLHPRVGWRVQVHDYLDAHQLRTNEAVLANPGIANAFSFESPAESTTNVFAIVGVNTGFGPNHRCNSDQFPADLILLIVAGASKEKWPLAEDIHLTEFQSERRTVKEVLGEVRPGVVLVLFADYEIWTIDSRVGCELLSKMCDVTTVSSGDRDRKLGAFRMDETKEGRSL